MRARDILTLGAVVGLAVVGCKKDINDIGKRDAMVTENYIQATEVVGYEEYLDYSGHLTKTPIHDRVRFGDNRGEMTYHTPDNFEITMEATGTLTNPGITSVCHSQYGCVNAGNEGYEGFFKNARKAWDEHCAKWDCAGLEAEQKELQNQEQEELERWQRGDLF